MIALGTNGGYPRQKVNTFRSPIPLWRATREESPSAPILPFGLLDQDDHRRRMVVRADDHESRNVGPRGHGAGSPRVLAAYPASGYSTHSVGLISLAHAVSLYQGDVPVSYFRSNPKSEARFGTGLSSEIDQFENHEPFSREPTHSVQNASEAAVPESYVAYAASLYQGRAGLR